MGGGQRLLSWTGPDPERVDVAMVDLGEDALAAGEERPVTLRMAWVSVPELDVSISEQHYAASAPVAGGGAIIRFSADDFVSHLEVDADGLVVNYPSIGRRVIG